MAREKKQWSDLTRLQQRAIIAGALVESVVTTAALRDLSRRPADTVRGPKLAWLAAFVVQPFGPLGYYLFGRRTA